MNFWTPRPETLTDFAWGATDSSALGSWAPQTKYAPLTVHGYPDIYPGGILPPGQTATAEFIFDVPGSQPLPRVSVRLG